MPFSVPDFTPALPEIFLLCMACTILLVDSYTRENGRSLAYGLAQLSLVGVAILAFVLHSGEVRVTFDGSFIHDDMSMVLKVAMYIATGVAFLYSRKYLEDRGLGRGEYYVLGLFALLGMMVLASAYSFLTLYLGLELMALSLYALVAFHRDSAVASEAAMKYFILGALASGMLLYGISMIYGATGTLSLAEVAQVVSGNTQSDPILVFGLVFVVVGVAFKVGAVPFHMWLPDVYHGAPTAVTLYLGSVPKLAAFAMAMRVLADGLPHLHADWQAMLAIVAVLSMAVGNIVAIAQSNIKRMLAYSTISHMGFMLMGILAANPDGYSGAMFYIVTYVLMALGAFGMVILLSRSGYEAERLDDFKGLNKRHPWLAFIMLLLMFSMAGVPPTVGFFAKLSVLYAVVQVDMVWLAVVAVVFSIIGAFYYIRVVRLMYFDEPDPLEPDPSKPEPLGSLEMRIVLSANGLLVLALGIYPADLMGLCERAFG